MTTSETGPGAVVQREPITLDEIKSLHDRTTWPAIQAVKARRDALIRTAIVRGDLTMREIAEALPMSEQHVGRIERGQTSGARPAPEVTPDPAIRAAELRQTAASLTQALEELGADLTIPVLALRKRAEALQARLDETTAQLRQLDQ